MAARSTEQLLHGQLAALSAPLSDDSLRALALIVGPAMLLEALDLIDKDSVARILPPNGRPIYQVASSSGGQPYTVYPNVPKGGGFCPCPAFSYGVLAQGNQVTCKHILACRIADRINAWEHKRVGLEWLAGLAIKFGTAVPPSLADSQGAPTSTLQTGIHASSSIA
ncbi:hypothetical protein BMF94_5935 [Rhodotorula taiwanensis]|uniref:SWIM-type domain-containing protein n=1 Tax=Rhodotorula taiwanensis TaxID=741276 RepID=A0A2S5B2L7_9BASI|nr:hypothetical protein BMF94_5935 [Rhodotorula taiwanensis]